MRMNKEELINLINSLKVSKEEFWVISSGALVMRDLIPDAGDLDIAVTEKGLSQLKENYNLIQKPSGFYIVNDKVECVCNGLKENLKYMPESTEYGIYLQNINEYLEYLLVSEREKDIKRIPIVKKYIEESKNE